MGCVVRCGGALCGEAACIPTQERGNERKWVPAQKRRRDDEFGYGLG
jgi:hypothetical protein